MFRLSVTIKDMARRFYAWARDALVNGVIPWLDRRPGDNTIIYALGSRCWYDTSVALAPVILAALRQYRNAERIGIPTLLGASDDDGYLDAKVAEWDAMLDKMIFAFDMIATEGDWPAMMVDERRQRDAEIAEGLRLFGLYYRALWD